MAQLVPPAGPSLVPAPAAFSRLDSTHGAYTKGLSGSGCQISDAPHSVAAEPVLLGVSELPGLNTTPPVSGAELGGAHGRRTPSSRPPNSRCERRRGIRDVRIAKERASSASRGAGSLSTPCDVARRSERLLCDPGLERRLWQVSGQLVERTTLRSLLNESTHRCRMRSLILGGTVPLYLGAAILRAYDEEGGAPHGEKEHTLRIRLFGGTFDPGRRKYFASSEVYVALCHLK